MDKITYLAELAEGLARWVPERERQDILRYYAEYFEEAGPDREAEVVAELGDPWALSSRLAVEGGYVTWEKAASWSPKKTWPKVLLGMAVGLTVFTLVFAFGLVFTNIRRSVSFTENPAWVVGEAEQVTFVDWDMLPVRDGEFGIGYAYLNRDPDIYFMAGENMASFSSIDADISLGNIEVVAGDDYTLSIQRNTSLTGYEPTWEITNGVLRLRDSWSQQAQVNSWDDLKNMFGGQAVDVIITVPPNIFLNKISIKTGVGDVLLYGVNSETVTAETGVGDIECYEARNVRRLELNTGVGNVCLVLGEVSSGLDVELESGTGNVEVSLGCSESNCAYTLESGLGCVTVNGNYQGREVKRRGNALCQLNAESGTGNVSVYFFA